MRWASSQACGVAPVAARKCRVKLRGDDAVGFPLPQRQQQDQSTDKINLLASGRAPDPGLLADGLSPCPSVHVTAPAEPTTSRAVVEALEPAGSPLQITR